MSFLFAPPYMTILDDNGNPLSGGRLKFSATGTTTGLPVYSDADLTVSLGSTVTADAAGRCVPVYLDSTLSYRCRVQNAAGATIKDVDPITPASSVSGEVKVTDFYDTADGLNYLPAVQAAYSYAKTNGIKKMRSGLPWGEVEWWAPTLSMADSDVPFDVDGPTNFLTISHDVDFDFEFCTINCKAYDGTSLETTTQAITGNAAWRGHGINVIGGTQGTSSFGIKGVSIRNLILDGGCDRVTGASAAAELASSDYLSHKGFRIQDTGVENLYFENVTIKRFRGEVWYFSQLSNTAKITLVNCNGYTSNQSALNPSSGNLTVIGGNFGDAPICLESLGGIGQQYIGTRFYDSWQGSISGAANFTPASGTQYQYNVPMNAGSEAELPWVDFRNVAMDNCGAITAYNYLRGNIASQDTVFVFNYEGYTCKMIDLDIRAVIHKRSTTALVSLQGPPTLTTAINGSYPAVYCQPVEDVALRLNVSRTAYAIANSYTLSMVVNVQGYIKQESCQITVDGDPDALDNSSNPRIASIVNTSGTQKSLPRVNANLTFTGRATTSWAAANKAISPAGPIEMLACTGAAGTYDITFTNGMDTANGYNYAHGQRLRCVYTGFTTAGTVLRFPNSGNWVLPRDIKLRAREDWIELSFSKFDGKFHYEAHSCGTEVLTGSATYDAPNIAAAGTATTTVTVTGAVLGDRVSRATFGVDLAGLVQTAYVSAANTVTIVLYNPTAGAIDLASTTVSAEVQKA